MFSSTLVLALPVLLSLVNQAQAGNCNVTTPCLRSAPCCSEFGFCGTDYFCLGGCNPYASKAVDSCRPQPICKDASYTFNDQKRILSNHTLFDGNATKYDWLVEGGEAVVQNGELALTLTETNGGTRITSSSYVHYGTITATMKTGKWNGVVTAFITMSDVHDEIDWEFPGAKVTEGQSNFFWQGNIPDPRVGDTHKVSSDTASNYHTYGIDWQPDTLKFLIDDKVVRTVTKESTKSADGVYHFPNTPSRVQFSLWPAGISSSGKGTIEWAGGMINWNDPDYKSAGRFYALLKSVTVKCAANPKVKADTTSYVYSGDKSTMNSPIIEYTNKSTSLKGAASMTASVSGGLATLSLVLGTLVALNAMLL